MAETLSTARALSLAALPLGHATTWCPCHGYREHAHLDVAAAHVVACGGGIEIEVVPHPKAGTRALVRHTGLARIVGVAVADDQPGLTLAGEAAALAQARASTGAR